MTAEPTTAIANLSDLARECLTVPGAEPVTDAQIAAASFISLGGDSLRALSLAGNAERSLGVRLRVADLLADVPLGRILGTATAAGPGTDRLTSPREAAPPEAAGLPPSVSSMQKGLWLGDQIHGGAAYCLVFSCHITGDLDPDLLATAIRQTGRRHDGLRTVFPASRGRISRLVTDTDLTLERVPCPAESADDQAAWSAFTAGVAERLSRAPFDLRGEPPIRLALASSGRSRHALVLAVHHILLDGWSIALVLREISACYDALVSGEDHDLAPATQAGAYDAWHQRQRESGAQADHLEFWRRRLDGVPESLALPSNNPRPPLRDGAGARLEVDLGRELTDDVRAAVRSAGITTTAFMLAALGLATARYTDSERLVIGMPVAGRPPELSELVGVTVNLLPVRLDVAPDVTVRTYLRAVQDSLATSLDHDAAPFADIVKAKGIAGSAHQHPLVQVAFGMHHNVLPAGIPSRHLEIEVAEGHGGGSQFDLELLINRAEPSLSGYVEYATDIWDERDAAGFVTSLTAAVSELAAAPDARLGSIRCVGAEGWARLAALSAQDVDSPPGSLDDWFRAQVAATPAAPALRDGDIVLSYAELDRAVTVQATKLRAAGVAPGDTVLIACPISVAEVVAVLGVIRGGAAYCGLDRKAPAARVGQSLATLRPSAVIGDETTLGIPVVPSWHPDWQPERSGKFADPSNPESLAYVAFTSGSTGGPKGVCVPHRGVQRLVAGLARYAPIGAGDRVLRMSPLSFDASTLEIWGALLTGAAVEIGPDDLVETRELGQFLVDRRVTAAWFSAGLFRLLVDFAGDCLGGLRVLLTGGDVVSATHVRALLDRYPGLTVVNGYGPTENTTFTTVHPMSAATEVAEPVPIGRPVAGTAVRILDSRDRVVPPGAMGELHTGGAGLASGYLGDPERTAAAFGEFCPDLPERLYRTGDLVRLDGAGNLRFLGRRDHQVKVRGFRIELDEIRTAIMSSAMTSLRDCLVVAAGADSSSKQLVAAVLPAPGAEPDLVALVDDLAARLPAYMVPRMWTVCDELPVTHNGKIDRDAIALQARPVTGTSGEHHRNAR